MDHFNATVKDGKLVKTRRGMQVSRQRFNGMSFVNASPHDVNAVGSGQPTPWGVPGASGPSQQQEIRFIEEEHGGDHHFQPEATQRRNIDSSGQLPSTAAHGARRRRKATVNKGKSPTDTTPKLNTPPHQPSPPPFGELSSQLGRPPFGRGEPQPNTNAASASPVEGVPRRLQAEPALIDDSRFHGYSSSGSRTMYPYEDLITYNPSRGADMYSMIAGDRAAQHCVFMCGAMVESVEMERPEPEDLTYHISSVCAILNQKLGRQQNAVDAVTLLCISKLACLGCFVGRLDHWHLHMSGLRKVLDLHGGLAGLPPWLLASMYKADLRGATALASTPYLPFIRQQQYTSLLPTEFQEHQSPSPAHSLSTLLNPFHIHPDVIDALSALADLTSAIYLARRPRQRYQQFQQQQQPSQPSQTSNPPAPLLFDPHVFTEEWQRITHVLLTRPRPLRAAPTIADWRSGMGMNPYSTETRVWNQGRGSQTQGGFGLQMEMEIETGVTESGVTKKEDGPIGGEGDRERVTGAEAEMGGYGGNHRLVPSVPIIPFREEEEGDIGEDEMEEHTRRRKSPGHERVSPLEPALRIAALLHLKELLPDWPRNSGGYAVMLALLRYHLEEVLQWYGTSGRAARSDRGTGDGNGKGEGRRSTGSGHPGPEVKEEEQDITEVLGLRMFTSHRDDLDGHRGDDNDANLDFDGDEDRSDNSNESTIPPPDQHNLAFIRPILLFLALVGSTVSSHADINEGRIATGDRYPQEIYRDCLTGVLGLKGPDEVDILVGRDGHGDGDEGAEDNWALVKMFRLEMVFNAGEVHGEREHWERGAMLRRIVAGTVGI